MNQVRDHTQAEVVDLYMKLQWRKACGVLSTGFGKSKVAIDIIKRVNPKKVLILVNSTPLRDFNWEQEFLNWQEQDLFDEKVELVTYQAAYKWKKEDKDLSKYLIIADEVDFAANTDELSKFFYEYEDCHILGLTGFITENKRDWFEKNLPVFIELNQDQAQEMKILNNIHFIFVQFDLSNDPKDVEVTYKKYGETHTFTQSQNKQYDYLNKKVQTLIAQSQQVTKDFMMGRMTHDEMLKAERSYDYKIKQAIAERNNVLFHSKAHQTIAKGLLSWIAKKNPESKTIVFSKRVEQSIEICGEEHAYNGKISKKQAQQNFEDFATGKKKILGVCDKVNRGVNIEHLDTGIMETFYGSDTKATQRLGRLMRLSPDQYATVFILLPYYMRKEKNGKFTLQETQQVKWARSMLRSTKVKSSAVWNYCAVNPVK